MTANSAPSENQAVSGTVNDARRAVAIAILHRDNQFLLQLRDDIPGIPYPGYWAFFGGHLEPGETPEEAIQRELLEEIGHQPPALTKFGIYADDKVVRHVFQGPLTVGIEALVLGEGWDFGFFTIEDIQRGDRYSEIAQQVRPLGPPHQKILLDFLSHPCNP
ncbi:NUDIX hydrolase [Trichocoleus sp. FACHB-591]|uniref:NUDIX hydrolase n=1 Tax=Trichocoleus sp. FACHB-591 TaxID=2692872 RepID=UPI0016834F81|nr:NUDIX hydrolase [Trichocoleus sp. FACHB-591]MBD2096095.1 NUDIX hydrolase [Trichocoleus sp. FACHB-591]